MSNGVTINQGAYEPDTAYHEVGAVGEPAFANGWSNFDSGYCTVGFRMDADGWVHVKGMAKSGTMGLAIFTLPFGYRPKKEYFCPAMANTGVPAYCKVAPNGQLSISSASGTNAWVTFNLCRFPAWTLSREFASYRMLSSNVGGMEIRANDTDWPIGTWKRPSGMVEIMGVNGVNSAGNLGQDLGNETPYWTYMFPVQDATANIKRADTSLRYGLSLPSATTTYSIVHGEYGLFEIEDNWTTPSLLNSWIPYGYNTSNRHVIPGYWKDDNGVVHLRGLLKSGSSATATMLTLPAGYRPALRHIYPTFASGTTCSRVDVHGDGTVAGVSGTSTAYTSLDGIQFVAEQ